MNDAELRRYLESTRQHLNAIRLTSPMLTLERAVEHLYHANRAMLNALETLLGPEQK